MNCRLNKLHFQAPHPTVNFIHHGKILNKAFYVYNYIKNNKDNGSWIMCLTQFIIFLFIKTSVFVTFINKKLKPTKLTFTFKS